MKIKVLYSSLKLMLHMIKSNRCFTNQSSVQIFKIKIPSYKIKISVIKMGKCGVLTTGIRQSKNTDFHQG